MLISLKANYIKVFICIVKDCEDTRRCFTIIYDPKQSVENEYDSEKMINIPGFDLRLMSRDLLTGFQNKTWTKKDIQIILRP